MNILTGSFILNIILFLIILFKSALNDIVKDWWKNIQQTKKEKQELLLDLREILEAYKSTFNTLLLAAYSISTKNETFQEIISKLKAPSHNQAAFDSVKRRIGLLPTGLKIAYSDIVNKSSEKTIELLYIDGCTKEKFNEIKTSINREFDEAIILVDDYLKKYN